MLSPAASGSLPISYEDIQAAGRTLLGIATRTPVVTSRTVNSMTGRTVFFKCENLQRGGAFKFRGAYNRLVALSADQRARGVVAFSSGNHAQGVALAARELRIPATIVMPTDSPAAKVAATRAYGAEIVQYDRLRDDREAIAGGLSRNRGLTVVPPYDDPLIMAGQGTAALELVEEVGSLDLLVVPVGGGGLISGCATAVKGGPEVTARRVVGVETETANDWVLSLRAGHRVRIPPPSTIADGMRTEQPGELTFPVVQRYVDEVTTVSDAEVESAMGFLLTRLKLLVEPTGAVPAALVFAGRAGDPGDRVGIILSGGNVDASLLCQVLGRQANASR